MRVDLPISVTGQTSEVPDIIFLTGELAMPMATELCKDLLSIEIRNNHAQSFPPIQLIINTPGGDLNATWMICDLMATMQTPVHTYALGQVASGGFMIFMNGAKGARQATQNTQFMSHRYSMAYEANHANIKSQQPELDRLHSRMVDHYRKCTGLSVKNILKHLLTEHDVWLTAEECKQLNVCDVIIDTNPGIKSVKPLKKTKEKATDE